MAVLWLQTPRQGLHLQVRISVRFNYSVAVVFNRDELKLHLSSGVLTHLNVSFSRLRKDEVVEQRDEQARLDNEDRTESFNVEGRYVQDNILAHGVHVVSWIVKDLAAVYVCG